MRQQPRKSRYKSRGLRRAFSLADLFRRLEQRATANPVQHGNEQPHCTHVPAPSPSPPDQGCEALFANLRAAPEKNRAQSDSPVLIGPEPSAAARARNPRCRTAAVDACTSALHVMTTRLVSSTLHTSG